MHNRTALRGKKRPLLPADFVRSMLAGHSALGLAFAALIYVVCLSGTISVFVQELQRWEQPDAPLVDVTPTADAISAAVHAGYAQALAEHAAHDVYVAGPLRTPGRFQVHYDDHERGIEGEWLANEEGRLVARISAPWSEFIGDLHMHLHLPQTWGKYLVGLTGVALFSSLISGLLAHPRIFKDAFALRWGGSRRLQEADLHNRLGVWGLPFHVVVTVTGALLGLSSLIIGVLALAAYDGDRSKAVSVLFGPRAGADETAAPVPDVGAMIRQINVVAAPDEQFSSVFLQHIGTAGQSVQLGMHVPGQIAFSTTYRFSGDGKLLANPQQTETGPGRWILGALQPLHFGWYGGPAVKLLYGLLGIALTIVTSSGVAIWLARRRDKGRPAPGWEKAWAVMVWGQPLAFGATATAAILSSSGEYLVAIYLTTIIAAAMLVWPLTDGRATSRTLRLLSALALLSSVIAHVLVWWGRAGDPMAWYVDVSIVLIVASLTLPLIAAARRGTPLMAARESEEVV